MNRSAKTLFAMLPPLALALALAGATAAQAQNSNIFTVVQATGASYVPVSGPVACGTGYCTTRLEPATVINLGAQNAANTTILAADLAAQKPAYTLAGFGPSLNINFVVTDYEAINDGATGGGQLVVDYVGQGGFVAPAGLHWLQIVNDNFNITGVDGANLTAPTGIGNHENVIDAPGVTSPYYDDASAAAATPFNTRPPHFEDYSRRTEPTAANPVITWNAVLYLVSDDGLKNITVHNAVEWGWVTTFAVPEPSTWALLITGFGAVGVMLRRRRLVVA